MKSLIKISIIIPVYNVAPYLPKCLETVCNQTLKEIEILCVDDCSTDNSLAILKEYAEKDSRIKLISLDKNYGVSVARNHGLDRAKGEYLGFVDPDDYIDLNFYEELYTYATKHDSDIVKSEMIFTEIDGTIWKSKLNLKIDETKNKFRWVNEWPSAIYRHELIKKNNINFPLGINLGEDVVFQMACLAFAQKLDLIFDTVYYYQVKRENSLSTATRSLDKILSSVKACTLIFDIINASNCYETNPDFYTEAYLFRLGHLTSVLRYNTEEIRYIVGKHLVTYFKACKNRVKVEENFPYKFLLPFIRANDFKGLINALAELQEKIALYRKSKSL